MFKKELSNEDIAKLKEAIRTKIRERKIEEENTTASADGYNTPYAFGKDTKGDIKRKVKSAGKGFEYAKSISENRWLELKREESSPKAKVGRGVSNIHKQLSEIEKFVNWYSKIKNENGLKKEDYWKRTNASLYKIRERLMGITEKLRTL